MSLQINRSFAANSANALQAYHTNQTTMGKAITRVSTGKRVNSASDDVSAYLSGRKFQSAADGYSALYKGVQSGATYLNAVDNAMTSISDMLQSMRSLAIEYNTLTDKGSEDAEQLKQEFDNLNTAVKAAVEVSIGGKDGLLSVGNAQGWTFQTALASDNSAGASDTDTKQIELSSTTTVTFTYSFEDAINSSTVGKNSAFYGTYGSVEIGSNTYELSADSTTIGTGGIAFSKFASSTGDDSYSTWYLVKNDGTNSVSSGVGIWRFSDLEGTASDTVEIRWFTGNDDAWGKVSGNDSATTSIQVTNESATTLSLSTTEASLTDAIIDSNNELTQATLKLTNGTYNLNSNGSIYSSTDTSYSKELGTWEYSNKGVISLYWNSSASGSTETGNIDISWSEIKTAVASLDITSASGVADAINAVAKEQVKVGAGISALSIVSDHLSNISSIMDNSYTAITEADMAEEMTNYVKSNIYAQAAQAMIAQANQSLAQVLNLLQ